MSAILTNLVLFTLFRGKSLTRTPLRIGVDIVKNIVEKHGCFDHTTVVVFKLPLIITTSKKIVDVLKKPAKGAL